MVSGMLGYLKPYVDLGARWAARIPKACALLREGVAIPCVLIVHLYERAR